MMVTLLVGIPGTLLILGVVAWAVWPSIRG